MLGTLTTMLVVCEVIRFGYIEEQSCLLFPIHTRNRLDR